MIRAQDIVDYVFEIAPNPQWATENIFEFGDGNSRVEAVGAAWWITSDMLEQFPGKGITLGLSHEKVTYPLPDWYHWGEVCKPDDLEANRRIKALVAKHGIAIHRFHSNLDVASWGMPAALLEQLGWQDCPADWSRGVPVVTAPKMTLRQMVAHVKAKLDLPFVRFDGDPDRQVSRVAMAWGGLCQFWAAASCAAPLGFDLLLGGDIIDGVVRLCREQNWAVIDALHHATEMGGVERLVQRVQDKFPALKVHYFQNTMPWSVA